MTSFLKQIAPLFISVAAILAAGRTVSAGAQQTSAPVPADARYKQAGLPIEDRVRDLLSRMTVEEKARQLDMYRGVSPSVQDDAQKAGDDIKAHGFRPEEAEKVWGSLGVGSIHDLYGQPELNNAIQTWVIKNTRLGIPALFAEEGLHGFSTGTIFPAQINLAATWNRQLARRTGAAIAAEARATGVDMLFAPVLDLAREPRWGRVEEDFGEDPYLTGQMGLAYVQGYQGDSLASDHTVIAEPKHFAGHGSPESGTNTSPAHYGERELRSVMLKAFEPAFREGHAMGTMAAYHEIDGIPVTADPFLLKTILRANGDSEDSSFRIWAPSSGCRVRIVSRPAPGMLSFWPSIPASICSSTTSITRLSRARLSMGFAMVRSLRQPWIALFPMCSASSLNWAFSTIHWSIQR
jgi:beta-glucosidase